ncbi:MAG: PIG-L family deacetylase [Casimicrobium sp.]
MNEKNSAHALHDFVAAIETLMLSARALPPPEMTEQAARWAAAYPQRASDPPAPVCVMVSPHPDDECIVAGLPLRLARESGWRVVNIAVTHGSNTARQSARADELSAACARIGFESQLLAERGLSRITLQTRQSDPAHWANCVNVLAAKLTALRPALVLCPHALDAQLTHIGTHHLTLDAMAAISTNSPNFTTTLAFTEYWSTMTDANLLVELTAAHVGDMISALACHVGEVSRNPFHLTLPGWLIDSVRRGGEIVGTSGGNAPAYTFAAIYNIMHWRNGGLQSAGSSGQMIGRDASCAAAFNH